MVEVKVVLTWRFVTVSLVPEAFEYLKVAIVPEGVVSSVEDTIPINCSVLVEVT